MSLLKKYQTKKEVESLEKKIDDCSVTIYTLELLKDMGVETDHYVECAYNNLEYFQSTYAVRYNSFYHTSMEKLTGYVRKL